MTSRAQTDEMNKKIIKRISNYHVFNHTRLQITLPNPEKKRTEKKKKKIHFKRRSTKGDC
jgi:hypothetical protein